MPGARHSVGPGNAQMGPRASRYRRPLGAALVRGRREEHQLRTAGNGIGRPLIRGPAPRGSLPPLLRPPGSLSHRGEGLMDAFSYLSVLLSIILGLAITQVLQGYRALLLARGRVRHSATVIIWSLLLLVIFAQAWWASFGLRERQ